jgi:hypothetical protein
MIRTVSLACLALLPFAAMASAQVDDDEIMRLPGQGEVREPGLRDQTHGARLKPGAGLFLTFDTNKDGRISAFEIDAGIPIAFKMADENADGYLTALEQQDWAARLPTRDDSLANPFRFDPNLDRRVDLDEFTTVIVNLGSDYADEASGDVLVDDLKDNRPRRGDRRDRAEEDFQQRRGERGATRRNQSSAN